MEIIAGIVLYNPDPERLRENIRAIKDQVAQIVLIENGSGSTAYLKEVGRTGCVTIENDSNAGIAVALNQICEYGKKYNYRWAVTLDQDSVVSADLVGEYCKYTDSDDTGMICCKVVDRNFGELSGQAERKDGFESVETCITSASMIRLSAWEAAGGFCEKMFIDSVDFDMCFSLREHGYRIIRVHRAVLLHEVGHSRKIRFLGKDALLFNHSPLRCYYMIRNSFLLGRRHHRLWKCSLAAFRRILLINLYESGRPEKNKMMIKGIWHALIGRYGKL